MTLGDVRALQKALDQSPGPYLVHCGGGVDRSAAVAVLAAMALGGADYRTASAQLKSAYWGLMDADQWAHGRFEQYEDYCRQKGIGTGGWTQFLEWLESIDPGRP